MPMLAPDMGREVAMYVYAVRDELLRQQLPDAFSGGYPLRSIRVGEAEYPLRFPVVGRVYPTEKGTFEFVVDAVAPFVIGCGQSAEEALDDWSMKVHALFQRLLATRPFETDAADRVRWGALESLIDVAQYRRTTPISMRQVGRIAYQGYPFPRAVKWIDGTSDRIDLARVPAVLAGLKPGQWVEAVCDRDPLSGRLVRIESAQPISPIRPMSEREQAEFMQSLPKGESLPESELDWTTLE